MQCQRSSVDWPPLPWAGAALSTLGAWVQVCSFKRRGGMLLMRAALVWEAFLQLWSSAGIGVLWVTAATELIPSEE